MVPRDSPLRAIRPLVNAALARLSPEFDRLYPLLGRNSIAPGRLQRALLLQAFYSVRSERQLMEQITCNMVFRWFVGLSMDAPVWDVTVFTKNRERLLEGDVARRFFGAVLTDPAVKHLLSAEHFSVDGTLIEAWASMKSFRPKDGSSEPPGTGRSSEGDFHGEQRTNETHAPTPDADALLYRKARGQAAKLCYMGHLLMENRSGLVVDTETTHATGVAEREAAEAMIGDVVGGRITLGADKAYDVSGYVSNLCEMNVTPHVAQNTARYSAIDRRTTRHRGCAMGQRTRKRIEEAFGWINTTGVLRKTRHRGLDRVGWAFTLTAACNLVRIPKLLKDTG